MSNIVPNNTKARSEFLNSLAAEIAARENVDVTKPIADSRLYINEIIERGRCHRETARQVWARYLRRARHKLVVSWGGVREGAGRKPTMPAPDGGDSPAKTAEPEPKKSTVKKAKSTLARRR